VLRFLSQSTPTDRAVAPEDLCKRIEINLCDFVLGVLKSSGEGSWEDKVALTIRQKTALRQEEERNRLPKEAYFDLIDFKDIVQKHWPDFEQHFSALGEEQVPCVHGPTK